MGGQILHVKDAQQLKRALMLLFFALPECGQAENAGEHAVTDLVVKADAHIVLHRHVAEQADILKRAGDAEPVGLHGIHARGVASVEKDGAHRGLVYLGQQVKHGGLARAVGADQARDFRFADDEVEILHGMQAAELNAQMAGLQDGRDMEIPLRNDAVAGRGNHLGGGLFLLRHALSASFKEFSRRAWGRMRPSAALNAGLLVASMTRISTMA